MLSSSLTGILLVAMSTVTPALSSFNWLILASRPINTTQTYHSSAQKSSPAHTHTSEHVLRTADKTGLSQNKQLTSGKQNCVVNILGELGRGGEGDSKVQYNKLD